MLKPKEDSRIDRAELSQPLCTAVQLALVNALGRYKIHPSAVVGHSSGEIGAAYASNALPMDVAIMIAYYRGFVTRNQPRRGAMAALGLGPAETAHFLRDGVVIACENSVNSTTISGDVDEVKRMIADVKEHRPDTLARELKVEMAYHSRTCLLATRIHKNVADQIPRPYGFPFSAVLHVDGGRHDKIVPGQHGSGCTISLKRQ